MNRHAHDVLLVLALLTAAGAAAAPVVVENPAAPAGARQTIVLQEVWRAGGDDDEVIFGNVQRVLAGPDGAVLVLDSQLSQVQVYDATGRWLRSLSRAGEGPGEVRGAADCFLLPDGRLCVAQSFPGRLVFLQPDGTPAGQSQYQPQGAAATFSVMVSGLTAPGGMLLAGIRMNQSGGPQMQQTFFLARCGIDGKEEVVYLEKPYTVSFADFRLDEASMDFVWVGRMAVGGDGRVLTAPERNRYLVRVQAPDGGVVREFTRPGAMPQRSAAERAVATKILQAVGANYGMPLQGTSIEDTEPAITGLWVRPDGEIWVMSPYNKPAAGEFALLDAFDPDGRYLRQVALVAPGDAARDGLYLLDDGRIVIVAGGLDAWLSQQGVEGTGDDAVLLEVVCYAAP